MPTYQWTKVTDQAAFALRDGAGALVFNNRMWFLGEWNPDDKIHFPKICNLARYEQIVRLKLLPLRAA